MTASPPRLRLVDAPSIPAPSAISYQSGRAVPPDSSDERDETALADRADQRDAAALADRADQRDAAALADRADQRDAAALADRADQRDAAALAGRADQRDAAALAGRFSLTLASSLAGEPAEDLLALDALLAAEDPPSDDACRRLAALTARVPGRSRRVAAALGRASTSAAVDALLTLPPGAPGVLEALHGCFARGVRRDLTLGPGLLGHVLTGSEAHPAPLIAPPLLALDFRGSRASRFPELVRRAQTLGLAPGAAFEALDLDGKRRYRLAFWPDRVPPMALAVALRASHLDIVWLHARLARLQGSRLWLSGWCFASHGPHSPTTQSHLLQAWLHFAEQEPPQ